VNCEFLLGVAEMIFAHVAFPSGETAAVLDPPRAGCDEAFLRQLIAFAPARVVYVSCDPATQARDIKILAAGGYRLLHSQPFDLFPQTRHIENVATLANGTV
jgi:23S rRNA (uracil1939-C5)-methyltransferase/tRNA (uracil-5-)-methyltransferase